MGKTAFAVNFVRNAAEKGTHGLLFSLESGNGPLVQRIAAAKLQIPLQDIRTGRVNDFQKEMMSRACSEFARLPIKIDSKSRKLSAIKKSARKWAKRVPKNQDGTPNGMILIDYLQLMSVDGKGNREQEIATISRDLKELAAELKVPVIALSQLNREVEKTANKKPGLAHLRESGAIEQDANVIMFVWWEELPDGRQLHLLVEKNRDGSCGDVPLRMNGDLQKIMSMDDFNQNIPPSFVAKGYRDPSTPNANWNEDF